MVWKTAERKIVGMATLSPPPSPTPPAAAPHSKTVCTKSEGKTRCVTTIEWVTPLATKPVVSAKLPKVVTPPTPKVGRPRREVRYARRTVR